MSRVVSERLVKSFLDLFVLALLYDGSKHGYEMMQDLKARTGTKIGAGTLYPVLYELEERQLILGEWVSPTKRSRRVYKITEKGERYREQGFGGINRLLRASTAGANSRRID